jgi:hypothetical protein
MHIYDMGVSNQLSELIMLKKKTYFWAEGIYDKMDCGITNAMNMAYVHSKICFDQDFVQIYDDDLI